jgi:hypothetical protein
LLATRHALRARPPGSATSVVMSPSATTEGFRVVAGTVVGSVQVCRCGVVNECGLGLELIILWW